MKQSINQKSTALAVVLLVVVSYYNTSAHGGIRAKAVTWFQLYRATGQDAVSFCLFLPDIHYGLLMI